MKRLLHSSIAGLKTSVLFMALYISLFIIQFFEGISCDMLREIKILHLHLQRSFHNQYRHRRVSSSYLLSSVVTGRTHICLCDNEGRPCHYAAALDLLQHLV